MAPRKQPDSLDQLFQGGTRYPQGVPNMDRVGAGIDASIWSYLGDQSDAIAEVCARLGRPSVTLDSDGYEVEIAGGAVDRETDRVAWVESRSKGEEIVDVTFRLHVERNGTKLFDWELATYNPYFGCHVGFVRFYGNEVALTYHEKHWQILAVVGPRGARLLGIDDFWIVRGDRVSFMSREPGLVESRRLPSLEARSPLLLKGEVDELESLEEAELLGVDAPLVVSGTTARSRVPTTTASAAGTHPSGCRSTSRSTSRIMIGRRTSNGCAKLWHIDPRQWRTPPRLPHGTSLAG